MWIYVLLFLGLFGVILGSSAVSDMLRGMGNI
jgi:hypothetical protein